MVTFIYAAHSYYKQLNIKNIHTNKGTVTYYSELNNTSKLNCSNEKIISIKRLNVHTVCKKLFKNKENINAKVIQFIDEIYSLLNSSRYELLLADNLTIHDNKEIFVTFKTMDDGETNWIKLDVS